MILDRIGNKYHLGCPGCGKRTIILELKRPFDAKRDDIAYCNNRKTCPLPKKPFRLVNLANLRVAQMRVSTAAISARRV
jgi:predicted Ser/Thr protein kinase